MNASTKKPAANADEKKAKAKEIAKKARDRRIAAQATMIDIGAEGVAAIDALCESIERAVQFRPTRQQAVARLIAQAKATADGASTQG